MTRQENFARSPQRIPRPRRSRRIVTEILLQNRLVQLAVKTLQLPRLVNGFLHLARVERGVNGTDLRYRVRYCDTFLLAKGIFGGSEYGVLAEDAARIRTIVDLGCNVGLFPLYLCSLRGDRDIRGFLVDANPGVVLEAAENLKLNGLDGRLSVLHGLASGRTSGEETFVVTPNSLSSTADSALLGTTYGSRKIQVPAVDVCAESERRLEGGERIDLLKLDIEGCELEFLSSNEEFLARCDRVVMEFHKPKVTLDAAKALLSRNGFDLASARDRESDPWGIAYFRRPGL